MIYVSIKAAVLDGFHEMIEMDVLSSGKINNGSGDSKNSIVVAAGITEFLHSVFDQIDSLF